MDLSGNFPWMSEFLTGFEEIPTKPQSLEDSPIQSQQIMEESSMLDDLGLIDMDSIDIMPFANFENELHDFEEIFTKDNNFLFDNLEMSQAVNEDIDPFESDFMNIIGDINNKSKDENNKSRNVNTMTFNNQQYLLGELMDEDQSESLYPKDIHKCQICSEIFNTLDNLNTHYLTCFMRVINEGSSRSNIMLDQEIIDIPNVSLDGFITEQVHSKRVSPNTLPSTEKLMIVQSSKTDKMQEEELPGKSKNSIAANYECTVCSRTFRQELSLLYHFQKHALEIQHDKSSQPINLHASTCGMHGKDHEAYFCNNCDTTGLVQLNSLDLHKQSHNSDRPFICSACGSRFRKKNTLIGHLRTHTGEKPYKCHICSRSFSQLSNKNRHLISHRGGLNSVYCSKYSSAKQEKLFVEIITPHAIEQIEIDSQRSEDPITTDSNLLCAKMSLVAEVNGTSNKILKKVDVPLLKMLQKRQKSVDKKARNTVHTCSICQKTFSFQSTLNNHFRKHTKERPHRCSFCPKTFMHARGLKHHEGSHPFEWPHPCTECSRGFRRESDFLTHHRLYHTGSNFLCSVCGRKFRTKVYLEEHMSIHTVEKSYKCNICQLSFRQRRIRNRHFKSHFAPLTCKCCLRTFSKKEDLNDHIMDSDKENVHICTVCGKGTSKDIICQRYLIQTVLVKLLVCTECKEIEPQKRHGLIFPKSNR